MAQQESSCKAHRLLDGIHHLLNRCAAMILDGQKALLVQHLNEVLVELVLCVPASRVGAHSAVNMACWSPLFIFRVLYDMGMKVAPAAVIMTIGKLMHVAAAWEPSCPHHAPPVTC